MSFHNNTEKLWTDDDEIWPARRPSKPDIVLEDDELIDSKKLVPDLSFIEIKDVWGVYFQGSIRAIPEDDFRLIESEMKKIIAERSEVEAYEITELEEKPKNEKMLLTTCFMP